MAAQAGRSRTASDAPQLVECVASSFVVCGLELGQLQPLLPTAARRSSCIGGTPTAEAAMVVDDVCVLSTARGEECPEGFELVEVVETAASVRSNRRADMLGADIMLAVRMRPVRTAGLEPITGLSLLLPSAGPAAADGQPDADSAIVQTVGGESASLAGAKRPIFLCPSRSASAGAPLVALCVLVCPRQARGVQPPRGYELIDRNINPTTSGAAIYLCCARASPVAIAGTPLKPSLLDAMVAVDRDLPVGEGSCGSALGEGSAGFEESYEQSAKFAADALPHALPYFCLPLGAQLRDVCEWPTAHHFALTDAGGRRMYGTCITVWEPLGGSLIVECEPLDDDGAEGGEEEGDGASEPPAEEEAGEGAAPRRSSSRPPLPPRLLVDADACAGPSEIHDVCDDADGARRRAHIARVAFADGACAWLVDDGAPPPLLRPSRPGWRLYRLDTDRLYAPKCLCVLSSSPFLRSLRAWLCQLYRHSLTLCDVALEQALPGATPPRRPTALPPPAQPSSAQSTHARRAPPPQLVASLLWECPLPPPGHVSVRVCLPGEDIVFARPAPSHELPRIELGLGSLLHALSPQLVLSLFCAALLEHKIILVSHSLCRREPFPLSLLAHTATRLARTWP